MTSAQSAVVARLRVKYTLLFAAGVLIILVAMEASRIALMAYSSGSPPRFHLLPISKWSFGTDGPRCGVRPYVVVRRYGMFSTELLFR